MFITTMIVHGGIEGGIERWSKILMPVLFVLLIGLIIYSNTLEGSGKGLAFYLQPDFSKITGRTMLAALGQAFFSMSLGMGLMITYGSYVSKKDNLISSASFIGLFDTLIAIMAGLIIFPALFAMGESPSAGPSLVFVVFPKLFTQMPGGYVVGTFFFLLLSVAALTSTISLLEVPVTYVIDEKKGSRKKVVWGVALFTYIIGIPSALSQGATDFFTDFSILPARLSSADFLGHMSFIWGDFSLAFGAFFLSIFVGWVWGGSKAADEIETSSPGFAKTRAIWIFMIRYFIPIVIFMILLNLFGIFD
jgi:NSS family neurotransmitter:Na+ symporter